MNMYICTHIWDMERRCVHTFWCVHIFWYVHTFWCVHMNTYIRVYIWDVERRCIHIFGCVYTWIHMYMYTFGISREDIIHICIHIYRYTYVDVYTYKNICVCTYLRYQEIWSFCLWRFVHIFGCVYIWIHIYVYTFGISREDVYTNFDVYTYIHMYTCIHLGYRESIHTDMYSYIHICIHIYRMARLCIWVREWETRERERETWRCSLGSFDIFATNSLAVSPRYIYVTSYIYKYICVYTFRIFRHFRHELIGGFVWICRLNITYINTHVYTPEIFLVFVMNTLADSPRNTYISLQGTRFCQHD